MWTLLLFFSFHPLVKGASWTYGGKIAGGFPIGINEVPYHSVFIFNRSQAYCSSAIISKTWVVTSAHCVSMDPSGKFMVRYGSSMPMSGGKLIDVLESFVHPLFHVGKAEIEYDIALIKVAEEIEFQTASNIKLPAQDISISTIDKTNCLVTGFGLTKPGKPIEPHLAGAFVPIWETEKCQAALSKFIINENHICAGYQGSSSNSCKMFSGGLLQCNQKLIGISSWGLGCSRPDTPNVYTYVSAVRNWIKKKTDL